MPTFCLSHTGGSTSKATSVDVSVLWAAICIFEPVLLLWISHSKHNIWFHFIQNAMQQFTRNASKRSSAGAPEQRPTVEKPWWEKLMFPNIQDKAHLRSESFVTFVSSCSIFTFVHSVLSQGSTFSQLKLTNILVLDSMWKWQEACSHVLAAERHVIQSH